MIDEFAFSVVDVPDYPKKPRQKGLTMIADISIGLGAQHDLIETAGKWFDLAKIPVGQSRVLPYSVLKSKIALYAQHDVQAFPGGMLLELAILEGRENEYLTALQEIGFNAVEVSDNVIELSSRKKAEIIRHAAKQGITVLGETGKKYSSSSPDSMCDDIKNMLEAGAWKVFVEAMEMYDEDGQINEKLVDFVASRIGEENIIFELPGPWVAGTPNIQHRMSKWFTKTFGRTVNLANVLPQEVIRLTCMRLGIGVEVDLPDGAYQLALNGILPRTKS
ncbi:MAG: phosphosulfolactate synthase [Firmicutes bacterium]|nr:phosphosulfolactate synthase [Bacillota bacterium]